MATIQDPEVRELLTGQNYATISTFNPDGTITSSVVWISGEDGTVAVNSAIGRRWPSNLDRDPRVTVLVQEAGAAQAEQAPGPDQEQGDPPAGLLKQPALEPAPALDQLGPVLGGADRQAREVLEHRVKLRGCAGPVGDLDALVELVLAQAAG